MNGRVVVERIEDVAAFERVRHDWNDVLQSSTSNGLFLTWEWAFTWWRHLSEARRLSLITVRRDSQLIALAPLAVRPPSLRRFMPWPTLEFLGSGVAGSDYLDVILRRGQEPEALAAVAEALAGDKRMLELSHVSRSASAARDLATRLQRREWATAESTINVCPFISLAGHSWESYLTSLGASQKSGMPKLLKSLTKHFHVDFERARSQEERREALALFVDLHTRRWRARGGSDSFGTPQLLAFYDDVSRVGLERGWLRLFVLRLNGRAAAAVHGYRYGDTFYFYQTTFDPEFSKHSVGRVILGLTIQNAIEEGVQEFDLLHGAEPYKFQWTSQTRELARIELFPSSAGGRLCRRAVAVTRGARRAARRLLGNGIADRLVRAGAGG